MQQHDWNLFRKDVYMSNWTHVAAIFRIDDVRLDNTVPDWDKIFGEECLFEDSFDVWNDAEENPENYLPMGSEGSLQKSVWINPCRCDLAAYTVSVFGDLRDHDSVDEIIDWFYKKCRQIRLIRQAVITVDNEHYGNRTERYQCEDID